MALALPKLSYCDLVWALGLARAAQSSHHVIAVMVGSSLNNH